MARNNFVKIGTLFPKKAPNLCAVCNQPIEDNRKKRYCSEHCKEVAYATQKFYDWKKIKEKIRDRDDWTCQRCGKYSDKEKSEIYPPNLHVDHIKPVSKGGNKFDPKNLQLLCKQCNLSKGAKEQSKSIEDFYGEAY